MYYIYRVWNDKKYILFSSHDKDEIDEALAHFRSLEYIVYSEKVN